MGGVTKPEAHTQVDQTCGSRHACLPCGAKVISAPPWHFSQPRCSALRIASLALEQLLPKQKSLPEAGGWRSRRRSALRLRW